MTRIYERGGWDSADGSLRGRISDLKSENGLMAQRTTYPKMVRYPGLADMTMIRRSGP